MASSPEYPRPLDSSVTRRMKANRKRDTRPEVRLRSALHANGLRFRCGLAVRTAHGVIRPDIVFTRQKVAVFVDGCFWHVCPQHGNLPTRNADYWERKLTSNVCRDRRTTAWLADEGWVVVRVWEHLKLDEAVRMVSEHVRSGGAPAPSK
jgi:DNA mismatch endonuclease (patch repair protein)